MSRFYDRYFKIGIIIAISMFGLLNIGSYLYARNEYLAAAKRVEFIPLSGTLPFPNWGFPFPWFDDRHVTLEDVILRVVLNVFVIVGCAFGIGLISKFIGNRRTAQLEI